MAVNGTKKVGVNMDMSSGAKLKQLSAASSSGEAVEYSQLNTALALKQDSVAAGNGLALDGVTINIDLTEGGTSYDSLTVSGSDSAINGVYSRLPAPAHFDNAGTAIDYTHNSGDYAMYWKDNGGGVYWMLGMRDSDGDYSNGSGSWYAFPVSVNPSTLSADYANIVPDYTLGPYDLISLSEGQDENGHKVPDPADFSIDYPTGTGASYLKFSNAELQADVITDFADAATGKLADSNTIKTYIDEQDVVSRAASSNTFVNTVAGLSGNPSNVQSAIEAAASEINTLDSQVVTLQNTDTSHTNRLVAHDSVLGVSQLDADLGTMSAGAIAFAGGSNSTVKVAINALGDSIQAVYANVGLMLGLGAFETDFGTGFIILSNNASAKTLFQEIETELQNLSAGVGQFWQPVDCRSEVNVNVSSPASDTFDGHVASNGERVLLKGQTLSSENGIYIFNGVGVAMTRATDADLSTDFSQNKTVQILNSATSGISGATFAYTGADDPTLGTDAITFALKSQGVVGDASVTEAKLATSLADKLNDKTDKYAETVTLVAGVSQNITHGLNSQDVIVQVRDTNGNITDVEIDITDSSFVTVNSLYSGDYRIVVIG